MDHPTIKTTEDALAFSRANRPAEEIKPKLILVVDDDADVIELVERIGCHAGYRVLGAASGEECLSVLSSVAPQLIMLDVNMAGIDGFETCRRVRSGVNGTHVPIAFLTARKAVADVKCSVAVGGDDFIVKPFNGTQLLERIGFMISCNHLLSAHRTHRSSNCGPPGAWLAIQPRRAETR